LNIWSNILLFCTVIFPLVACTSKNPHLLSTEASSNADLAQEVLINFLDNLNAGKFDQAAQLYGGSYETMQNHNPGLNKNDHSGLIRNACTINGIQCLQVKSVSLEKQVSDSEFIFKVEFLTSGGTLFIQGPCCGGNETDSPPQSVFSLRVVKIDNNNFSVLDMPPFLP
jgi:hypothetical protein